MTEVERIAAGLSKAQRDCLIEKRRVSGKLTEWHELIDLGLINMRPRATTMLTGLGLAVRVHLAQEQTDEA